MPCDSVITIILASGKGTRFGMPKAEAGWDGKSFLAHVRHTLDLAMLKNVFVARHYESPDMLATLRLAVKEIQKTGKDRLITGYLVFPVDFPFVRQETLRALIGAHYPNPQAVIRPCYLERCGHPIIIPSSLDLYADDGGQGLKGIIRASKLPLVDVPVEDAEVLHNINLREDLQVTIERR